MSIAIIYALYGIVSQSIETLPILQEPILPVKHVMSVSLKCDNGAALEIRGYNHMRPAGVPPIIVVNGRQLEGEVVDRIKDELSNPRGVYRLTTECNQDEPIIWLRIYYGEKQQSGGVLYKVGSVTFQNGEIKRHDPLSPATAETFWFR